MWISTSSTVLSSSLFSPPYAEKNMRAYIFLTLLVLKAVASQRCSIPADLEAMMNALPGQCLQDYRTFMNSNVLLATRESAASRWCSQCSQAVQHWYDDICVDLVEGAKIGHFCASNGRDLCYFVAQGAVDGVNATNVAITCGLEFENGTSTDSLPQNCTDACRSALQEAVTNAGCCFESAFNVSETPEITRRLADSGLWENCGMNTSSVDFCPERVGTRNCTEADVFQYLQTLGGTCVSDFVLQFSPTPENFDVRVEAVTRWCQDCAPNVYNWLLECGDQIDAEEIAHLCGHDGNRNCFHYTREARFYQNQAETCRVFQNQTYLPFPSTCPAGCADALRQMSDDLGCCFESAFNATDSETIRLGLANNNLWNTCGLDPENVNFCPNPFTDSGTVAITFSISALAAIIFSFVCNI